MYKEVADPLNEFEIVVEEDIVREIEAVVHTLWVKVLVMDNDTVLVGEAVANRVAVIVVV